MTPDNSDSDDPSDESSERPTDGSRGLLEQIRAVIEALGEIEDEEGGRRRSSGHIDRGGTRIDYGYDISIGLGLDDRPASPGERPDPDRSRSRRTPPEAGDGAGEREKEKEKEKEKEGEGKPEIHVETREVSDDELLVIADLPGVADDELDVTMDTDEPALELIADGETIDRIELDRPDGTITDASLTNQILEIRLAQSGTENGGESE